MSEKPTYEELEKRVRALEGCDKQLSLVSKKLQAFQIINALRDADIQTISEHVLFQICKMTNSQYGFYGLMDDDTTEMIINAWTDTAMKDCSVKDRGKHFPVENAGVWAEAVQNRTALVINDYASYEGKNGTPDGHVEIANLLVMPWFKDGKVISVIAVANKPSEYDQEDVTQLESFLFSIQTLVEGKLEKAKAKEHEKKLKNVIGNIPGTAYQFVLDNEGRFNFRYLGENCIDLFGYAADEIIADAKVLFDLIPQPDADLVDQAIRQSATEMEPYVLEHRVIRPDGETVWIHAASTPKKLENGDILWDGIGLDVTARKEAEEALLKSEEKFRLAFRTSPDSVNLNRLSDGEYIEINEGFTRIMGYTSEEILGKTSLALNIWKNEEDRQELIKGLQKDGYVENLEAEFIAKNGDVKIGLMSANILQLNGEKVILSITRDITERKQTELKLKEQEKQFRTLFEKSSDAIFIVNRKTGQYLNANNSALQLTGRTLEELLRSTIHDVTPERSKERRKVISKSPGVHTFGEVIYKRPDGSERVAILTSVPLDDNRVFGIARDITETLDLEKQLHQAQKMESIGRLAGGVAHDFNNMLSVIIGYTESVLDDLDQDSPLLKRLEEVKKAGERSADLTRQLLAFARKQTISPKVIDFNKTIEGALKMMKRLIGEDIELEWIPGTELWPIKIDPSQIDQILTNLCVNSRDAIKDVGKIIIETGTAEFDEAHCSNVPGLSPGEYVALAVSDNGSGMDKETLSKIFEPFFTTKESGHGTGLGLAMVYGVVKQNKGYVKAYSEPGQGTTIKIYLPRQRIKVENFSEKEKDVQFQKGHETILLVEDEPEILNMATIMLERLGYRVLAADTPGKAIRLAQEYGGEIHLLITDVIMPEMNGRDLAKNVLSIYPNIRRLFMSGYTANVIAHHGVLDEGVNFIQKPFSRMLMSAKVREALDS